MKALPIRRAFAALSWRLTLLFGASVLTACRGPNFIDEECIKGRLSAEQAEAVNQGKWQHLPSYNRDADGHCKNCATEQDRVLSWKCSQLIKEL